VNVPPLRDEVSFVRRRLATWRPRNPSSFPWRGTRNSWLGLVAEVLLQRTRASQVVPVYWKIALIASTPARMVRNARRVRGEMRSLGLHGRASDLVSIARTILAAGRLPKSAKELCALRGIGEYTAAAWLSMHRGERGVIVDANIFRWLARMTGRPWQRDPRGVRWVYEVAEKLTPQRAFREFNQAVLDFTMTICLPGAPRCQICPLLQECHFGGRAMRKSKPHVGSSVRATATPPKGNAQVLSKQRKHRQTIVRRRP